MAEIRKKLKEEQIRVREEVSVELKGEPCVLGVVREHILMCVSVCFQRHKEYIKMLKERKEALGA